MSKPIPTEIALSARRNKPERDAIPALAIRAAEGLAGEILAKAAATTVGAHKSRKEKSKPVDFKRFTMWKMLPPQLLGKSAEVLTHMGITDPDVHDMATIETHKDFAARYGLRLSTLTAWRKEIEARDSDQALNRILDQMTPKIMLNFGLTMQKKPTPQGIETWYDVVKDRKRSLTLNLRQQVELSDEDKEAIVRALGGGKP